MNLDEETIIALRGALACLRANYSEQNEIHAFYLERFLKTQGALSSVTSEITPDLGLSV
jgi:hypothetical protein